MMPCSLLLQDTADHRIAVDRKTVVKGLSRLLDSRFNLSLEHGRVVESHCGVALVGARSALGRGSVRGHGQAGLCSPWTPRAHGWGMAAWQSPCLPEPSRMSQEGRPLWQMAGDTGLPSMPR